MPVHTRDGDTVATWQQGPNQGGVTSGDVPQSRRGVMIEPSTGLFGVGKLRKFVQKDVDRFYERVVEVVFLRVVDVVNAHEISC